MKFLLAILLFISGCATHNPENSYIISGAADTISTRLALSTIEGSYELNPLGEGGVVVAKAAFYAWVKTLPEEEQAYWFESTSAMFYSFSANNLAVVFGLPTPVAILIGIITYINIK